MHCNIKQTDQTSGDSEEKHVLKQKEPFANLQTVEAFFIILIHIISSRCCFIKAYLPYKSCIENIHCTGQVLSTYIDIV